MCPAEINADEVFSLHISLRNNLLGTDKSLDQAESGENKNHCSDMDGTDNHHVRSRIDLHIDPMNTNRGDQNHLL